MTSRRFLRHSRWSTSEALTRIVASANSASDRKQKIELSIVALKAEAAEIDAFLTHLAGLKAIEEARPKRGRRPSAGEAPSDLDPGLRPEHSPHEGSKAIHRSAGEAASVKRYDPERKLFPAPAGFAGGSTEPHRFDPSVDSDPSEDRAAKMLEVPGLLHAMVLAERHQTVIDVGKVTVPEEALGLPQAEAYRDHVFGVDAFFALSDAATSEALLRKLRPSE